MSMVFQNFLAMVHSEVGGVWGENTDNIYAALILDGGSSPFDRSWKTMTDLTSRSWLRAAPATGPTQGDVQILNSVRTQAFQQSNVGSQFAQYSMVYRISGQVNFGAKTASQGLRCVVVYWDRNGDPLDDDNNEILFMDDENVNNSVTDTGDNIWGSTGANEVAAIQCSNVPAIPSYIMEAGVVQMHNEPAKWTGGDNFVARLFQESIETVTNPSDVTTLSQITNDRAQADAGGDVPDVTITPAMRTLEWDPTLWKWRFQIDPGGSALNFGTCASAQTVRGVAIADSVTENIWYWDYVMSGRTLATPTQITYGQPNQYTAFSFRAQTR